MEPIRVLQVLPALNFCGGIENYLMNYYRHIDRERIQFDFIIHTDLEVSFRAEIEALGGKIFEFPVFTVKKLPEILQTIDEFFKKHGHKYSAVHCHMANAAWFYFRAAKKYHVRNLVLHSHNSASSGKISHTIRNYPLLYLGNELATERIACTDLAGKFLFKGRPFRVVNNAIETDKFAFDENARMRIRNELEVQDKVVLGHIGRMAPKKNQLYAVEVLKEFICKVPNAVLIFIGNGEDEKVVRNKVHQYSLDDSVIFLSSRENVNEYYSAFDIFVFPSLYEGLGIVLIEAQCSGLKVLCSKDNIPDDVKVTDNIALMSLREGAKAWAEKLFEMKDYERRSELQAVRNAGYDIETEARKLEEYYLELVDKDIERKETDMMFTPPRIIASIKESVAIPSLHGLILRRQVPVFDCV